MREEMRPDAAQYDEMWREFFSRVDQPSIDLGRSKPVVIWEEIPILGN
jgi:hypothetical protein